jgi:hypothetical protein
VPARRRLVYEKPSADAIHGERDRGEIDDDFIRKAVHVDTTLVSRHQRDRFAAERAEGVLAHQSAGTIGIV